MSNKTRIQNEKTKIRKALRKLKLRISLIERLAGYEPRYLNSHLSTPTALSSQTKQKMREAIREYYMYLIKEMQQELQHKEAAYYEVMDLLK